MTAQASAPTPTPLPDLPDDSFFSPTQWQVLTAILDGILPSICAESAVTDKIGQISIPDRELEDVLEQTAGSLAPPATKDSLRRLLLHRSSQDARFMANILRTLVESPPSQQQKLSGLLKLMATRPGSYMITGYWYPIYDQPAYVREAIIKSWTKSRTVVLRSVAKTMITLAQKSSSQTDPIFPELSGYSDTPRNWKPGPDVDYSFLQLEPGSDVEILETDVVIVGSGCGGAVSAKNLAEAGHKVLVVDKGYRFQSSQLPMTQDAACNYLYDNRGFYMSDDNSCSVSAGGAWGGGGTVNWSVCLKLQDFVRKDWADQGLPFFASKDFDDCVERIYNYVGAGTDNIRHNHRNQMLLKGSELLGWAAQAAPQNTAGKEHFCGYCHMGCGSGEKRGPATSWLPDAASAGAQFLEGFQVDRVLFDEDGTTAVGIEGEWTSRDSKGGVSGPESERVKRRVVVKAKKVVMAAGSLWTPVLLTKSGVTNPHVGSNLHLHPCNFVGAVYKEETTPWEGGIITSYCSEFEDLDGHGHGVKLETTCMVPYAFCSFLPWTGGLDNKLNMSKFRHLDGYISITRDRDTGKVYPDPTTGRPRIAYTVSDYDRRHTLEGVEALAKICHVTGATEIHPVIPGLEPFIRSNPAAAEASSSRSSGSSSDPGDPDFASWLRRLRELGNKPPVTSWSSAHQMGTCRMGASADDGVVDEVGRVWGRQNLYIADASVFPTASGVNPMITVMTIADWVSRGMSKELKA